jgi:glycosyltransferase involved in cell wall biosynthesis
MPEKRLQIAYLSINDPNDPHVWSGTHYSIFKALQKHVGDVYPLGPYQNSLVNFVITFKKIFYKVVTGKRYNKYHSKVVSRNYGNYFSKKLKEKKFDLIVAVSASAELAYLNTKTPVIFVSDALFTGSLNYYATLSNLCKTSLKEGVETEQRALNKAGLLYLPSDWAKQNAIKDFNIPEEKIIIGPMGANLENIPSRAAVLEHKKKKDNSFTSLVFVGVNWENKGGPIAFACLVELLKRGYKAKLTVVGTKVPEDIKHENLINIPFIKKTTPEGRKAFEDLYMNADFLVLPTKFEAYGIVFCEASAFGVINLTTDTGGTSTPVKNGENGYLMSPKGTAQDYADKIISIYSNKDLFEKLQFSSRKRYEDVLNWDSWALNLKKVLHVDLQSFPIH